MGGMNGQGCRMQTGSQLQRFAEKSVKCKLLVSSRELWRWIKRIVNLRDMLEWKEGAKLRRGKVI